MSYLSVRQRLTKDVSCNVSDAIVTHGVFIITHSVTHDSMWYVILAASNVPTDHKMLEKTHRSELL